MIRLIAVGFALVVATSAQAMSPAPLHQPDGMIIPKFAAIAARGCAGMKHSVVARLHPPAAMSAAEWSQAATEKSKKPVWKSPKLATLWGSFFDSQKGRRPKPTPQQFALG